MKIVLNGSYGCFNLSKKVCETIGITHVGYCNYHLRTDPRVIAMVEEDPIGTGGKNNKLFIVEIPDEYAELYTIHEDDGKEDIEISPADLVAKMIKEASPDMMFRAEDMQKILASKPKICYPPDIEKILGI